MYSFSLSDVIVPCKGLLLVAIRCVSNMNRRHLRQSRTTRHTTNIMTKPVRDRAENTFCLDVPALFLGTLLCFNEGAGLYRLLDEGRVGEPIGCSYANGLYCHNVLARKKICIRNNVSLFCYF